MKTIIAYFLIFTYAASMLKPVLPYFSDAIAHVFWYSDHMATMHFEHGKFHVHLQSAEAAKADLQGKGSNTLKSEISASDHLPFVSFEILSKLSSPKKYFSLPPSFLVGNSPGYDYPPPRV